MEFSTFIPTFGCKNPNTRYFAHLENGEKKELKHHNGNIYYYCINRKRHCIKITGSLYSAKFEEIKETEDGEQ